MLLFVVVLFCCFCHLYNIHTTTPVFWRYCCPRFDKLIVVGIPVGGDIIEVSDDVGVINNYIIIVILPFVWAVFFVVDNVVVKMQSNWKNEVVTKLVLL